MAQTGSVYCIGFNFSNRRRLLIRALCVEQALDFFRSEMYMEGTPLPERHALLLGRFTACDENVIDYDLTTEVRGQASQR